MAASLKSLGIDRLNLEERIALVEEIWESIASSSEALPLTETQRKELDRRIAEHEAAPERVVAWAEVKAAALARVGQ
jgi:putative addiction module component (TIGR02574 family)